ncbi:MAG: hypothetical protein ACR2MA_09470 [Egibacteraceae bacterium]
MTAGKQLVLPPNEALAAGADPLVLGTVAVLIAAVVRVLPSRRRAAVVGAAPAAGVILLIAMSPVILDLTGGLSTVVTRPLTEPILVASLTVVEALGAGLTLAAVALLARCW